MSRIIESLGVQSYCYNGIKDNVEVAKLILKSGINRIELCCVHIDFLDQATHQPVIDIYKAAGISIPSIGVQRIDLPEAEQRMSLEFAKAAGAKVLAVNFMPSATNEQLDLAFGLAKEYDIRYGIHNHGGYHWLGNTEILDWIFSEAKRRGDTRLGLCLDTAWALDAKQDPVAMADRFADRLWGIHIKDFIFDRARKQTDVIVGEGNLDLPAFIKTVEKNGFDGSCVLEYEGDPTNPEPTLTQCVEAVRQASA